MEILRDFITASPKTLGFQTRDEGEERFQDSADMEGEALESLNTRKPRTFSPRKLINRYRFKDIVVSDRQETIKPNQVIRVERIRHVRRNLMVALMLGTGAVIGGFLLQRSRNRKE